MKVHYPSSRVIRVVPLVAIAIVFAGLIALAVLTMNRASAADPVITGGNPISGQTDIFIPVTGIEIQGDVVGSTTVSVRVDSGTLRVGTSTGITFTGPESGRTIVMNGTQADLNAALASLEYRANEPGAVTLTASLGPPGIVYYPGNGHIYEVVEVPGGITWSDATVAAQGRTLNGATGYLATISEQAENDYITQRLVGDGWFGASDFAVEDEWRWISGPETGTLFWLGDGTGTLQPGQFANWADGIEPNDFGSGEDCGQFYGDGRGWNDLPCNMTLGSYIVEYGAPGDMPLVPTETTVPAETVAPEPEVVSLSTCQQFFDEYVESNQHRYDQIELTQDLDCAGASVTALFSEVETYVDPEDGTVTRPIGFRGSFDGNGHTIRNLTITAREDEYGDLLPNGLFGALDASARVENLTLENVTIEGNNCIGGFVGRASGVLLRNLTFDGTITPTTGQSGYSVGGIIGCLSNNEVPTLIDDVEMTGQLTLPQGSTVGGLVGDVSMQEYDSLGATQTVTITNGTISGTVQAGYEVSGAIGSLYMDGDELEVLVSDIEVTGTVDGVNSSYNGGIIGEASVNASSLTIQDVTVSGSVTGDDHTGGILGYISVNYGSVLLSNAVVTTPITGEDFVGGVIGSANHYADDASEAMTIQNVRVVGDVSGDGTVGGIMGIRMATMILMNASHY